MRGRGLEQPGQLGGQPPWRADVAAAVDDDALLAVGKLERERGGMAGAGKPGRRRRADIADHHRLAAGKPRSEEHTSELQSLMRISYAVFCLKKKKTMTTKTPN